MAREDSSWEAELEETVERVPAFTLVGYRHLGTGVLASADRGPIRGDGWEPVFTGGPEVIEPVLSAAIALAEDRSEGSERRQQRFLDHRYDMQRALGEFVARGGQIP